MKVLQNESLKSVAVSFKIQEERAKSTWSNRLLVLGGKSVKSFHQNLRLFLNFGVSFTIFHCYIKVLHISRCKNKTETSCYILIMGIKQHIWSISGFLLSFSRTLLHCCLVVTSDLKLWEIMKYILIILDLKPKSLERTRTRKGSTNWCHHKLRSNRSCYLSLVSLSWNFLNRAFSISLTIQNFDNVS